MLSSNTHRVRKKHKYIRKEGNRYIYPEDLKRMQNPRSKDGKLVRTIADANGNKVRVRGAAATNTIANRSNHYDRATGERFSPSEYRTRMQDGSIDRMRGQVTQEVAKKQGQYSVNMMRQQKAAQQRSVSRQTMTSTPANLRINKQVQKQNVVRPVAQKKDPVVPKVQSTNRVTQTTQRKMTSTPANIQRKSTSSSNSQNVSTAASQAMQRAGYNGPVRRPQNQHVVAKAKKEETKTDTKNEERLKSLEKEIADLKKTSSTTEASDEDKKTTTKSSSTRSSGSSRSSSGSSGRSSSGSSSSGSSSSGSGSSSSGSSTTSSGSSSGSSTRSSKNSSSSSKKSKSSGGSSGSSSSSGTSESSDTSDKKEGAVLSAVDKKKDKKNGKKKDKNKDKKTKKKEKIDEEEGMLEDLESILDPNMNLANMSEAKINRIAERLGDIFSTGKSEAIATAKTKIKDSKALVAMGLNLLNELKTKTKNTEKSK